MVDIGIIKDVANLIAPHQAQPPTSLSASNFKGLSISVELFERPIPFSDINIGS